MIEKMNLIEMRGGKRPRQEGKTALYESMRVKGVWTTAPARKIHYNEKSFVDFVINEGSLRQSVESASRCWQIVVLR